MEKLNISPEDWLNINDWDKLTILKKALSEQEYANVVKDWYINTEFIHTDLQKWKDTFHSLKRPELLMDYEELNVFKNLPEKITIYRGSYSRWGISWTLNKDIAEWFATRFKAVNKIETVNTQVFKQEVYRDNCIAYFNDREEEEIIYLGQ
jgi:hypothetical protein